VGKWAPDDDSPEADVARGIRAESYRKPAAELMDMIGDRVYVELPEGASPLEIGRALRKAHAAR
jgi:hypothetical protein